MNPAATLPPTEVARLDASFPARAVALRDGGLMSVRECGSGPALVCLHGIGSGAASWLDTALRLAPQARVLAWDAPGYGASTPLAPALPGPPTMPSGWARCSTRSTSTAARWSAIRSAP